MDYTASAYCLETAAQPGFIKYETRFVEESKG